MAARAKKPFLDARKASQGSKGSKAPHGSARPQPPRGAKRPHPAPGARPADGGERPNAPQRGARPERGERPSTPQRGPKPEGGKRPNAPHGAKTEGGKRPSAPQHGAKTEGGRPSAPPHGAKPEGGRPSAPPHGAKPEGGKRPSAPQQGKRPHGGPQGARPQGSSRPRPPKPVAELLPIRRAGTVALVGRSNVGKSTLMNALLGQALTIVSHVAQTTRHRILGIARAGDAQIGLLDTPGLHKPQTRLGKAMNATARAAAMEADVVAFVIDPDLRKDPAEPHPGDLALLADVGKDKPMVLVVNKIDLVQPRHRLLPILEAFGKVRDFAAVVPVSAQRKDGLDRLLAEIGKLLPEGEALYGEDELTDRPVRFFVAELVRAEILRVAREELPYVVTVTVDQYDDTKKIPRIHATIHVEREGQKAMLVGKGGLRVRDIGIAARERVQALVEKQVHLELFVRVTEGWTNDPRLLSEMGFDESGGTK